MAIHYWYQRAIETVHNMQEHDDFRHEQEDKRYKIILILKSFQNRKGQKNVRHPTKKQSFWFDVWFQNHMHFTSCSPIGPILHVCKWFHMSTIFSCTGLLNKSLLNSSRKTDKNFTLTNILNKILVNSTFGTRWNLDQSLNVVP